MNQLNKNRIILKENKLRQVYLFNDENNKVYKKFNHKHEYKKELRNTIIASKLIKNVNIPEIISYDNNKKIIVYEYINGKSMGYPFNSNKIMTFDEYKKSIEIISLIHNTGYNNFKMKLRNNIYSGKHIKSIFKFDYKNICSDYKDKLKFIHNFIAKNNKIGKVLSHGDFKPNNIMINNSVFTVIDWIDIGIRYPMYDFGSIVYGLDYNKIIELADLYFKYRNIKYDNINNFIKESIAYACITHINGLIKRKDEKRITEFTDYAYNICLNFN